MKKLILLFAVFNLFAINLFSQENRNQPYIISLPKPGDAGYLTIENSEGSIIVTGYNGKNIEICSSLKNNARLKDYITIAKGSSRNGVILSVDNDEHPVNLEIKVPYYLSLTLSSDEGKIEVNNVKGELIINSNDGDIKLTNVNCSCIASAVDGSIYADFSSLSNDCSITLNTIDGKINLKLPANAKADIIAKSESGNIYTDFSISINTKNSGYKKLGQSGLKRIVLEEGISGQINGGGAQIILKSVDGNIYIRKEK